MNAEITLVRERIQHRGGYCTNSDLQTITVVNQFGDMAANRNGGRIAFLLGKTGTGLSQAMA